MLLPALNPISPALDELARHAHSLRLVKYRSAALEYASNSPATDTPSGSTNAHELGGADVVEIEGVDVDADGDVEEAPILGEAACLEFDEDELQKSLTPW